MQRHVKQRSCAYAAECMLGLRMLGGPHLARGLAARPVQLLLPASGRRGLGAGRRLAGRRAGARARRSCTVSSRSVLSFLRLSECMINLPPCLVCRQPQQCARFLLTRAELLRAVCAARCTCKRLMVLRHGCHADAATNIPGRCRGRSGDVRLGARGGSRGLGRRRRRGLLRRRARLPQRGLL